MNIHSHHDKKRAYCSKAIELFARDGFEATSIQKLAEASGVAQGLLYRHFKTSTTCCCTLSRWV